EEKQEKAVLLAQRLLQEHQKKMAAKGAVGKAAAGEDPESFRQAHARAMLSLQGLKKVKRVQDSERREDELYTPEQIVAAVSGGIDHRAPAFLPATHPWTKESLFEEKPPMSNWGLFFIGLL